MLRVQQELKKLDDSNKFIEALAINEGFPKWDYAELTSSVSQQNQIKSFSTDAHLNASTSVNDTTILIPLVLRDKKNVNSFIACNLNGKFSYKIYESDDYKQYGYKKNGNKPNANSIARKFIAMNFNIFKYDKFIIFDKDLIFFKPKPIKGFNYYKIKNKLIDAANKNGIKSNYYITVNYGPCKEEAWFYDDGNGNVSQESDWVDVDGPCGIETVWKNEISPGNGGGGGSGGGGGGGSSPGWGPINPLPPNQLLPLNLDYNKGDNDIETSDINNNPQGNEDDDVYGEYDFQNQTWPTIANVFPLVDFVGWNRQLHPNWQCMQYEQAQIAKKGMVISDYQVQGQTLQVYKSSSGVNHTAVKETITYLISSLQNGNPVIVGVDDQAGSPNCATDCTTDHFIVIVGMGTDVNGAKYFTFFDNASGDVSQGANPLNKLYYNSSTGIITGKSQTDYAKASLRYDYIVTQIRKNKK